MKIENRTSFRIYVMDTDGNRMECGPRGLTATRAKEMVDEYNASATNLVYSFDSCSLFIGGLGQWME